MIFSTLFAAALALPVKRATDSIPDNCKVLSTLFLQCSNGAQKVPNMYAPSCQLDADGYVECCAVTPDGQKTSHCTVSGVYRETGCKVLPDTLQLECHNSDGGYSLASPICWGSSDGSSKCCARNQDGSESDQCSSSPASTENNCIILDDLTTQCSGPNGNVRTPPSCETNNGARICCAVYQDGIKAGRCTGVA